MISIIYCERDFEAASIALKVQSLSQNQPIRIYIVPKHYGRNIEEVNKNLLQTTIAVFLCHDLGVIDGTTKNELQLLRANNIPIKYIVPSNYAFPGFEWEISNQSIYRYSAQAADAESIVRDISATLNEIRSQLGSNKLARPLKELSQKEDSAAIGLIILLAIVLLGLLVSSDD